MKQGKIDTPKLLDESNFPGIVKKTISRLVSISRLTLDDAHDRRIHETVFYIT